MKLAVKKEPGEIPGGGFHYMLFPKKMDHAREAAVFELMGYVVIEVSEDEGKRLLNAAGAALAHQMEVATLTEQALAK